MASQGLPHHDPEGTDPQRANLNGANLDGANLNGANLDGANLNDANLDGASFAGCSGQPDYSSIVEAIDAVRSWLTQERWIQSKWIETPDGAYAGSCRVCLHGAAVYIGGSYGPQISQALIDNGYTTDWNDYSERTHDEVIEALASLAD